MTHDPTQPRRGRPKGRKDNRTLALQQITKEAIAGGITPLEYMLYVLRRPDIKQVEGESAEHFTAREVDDMSLRLEAARMAAPFVHPRVVTTIAIEGAGSDPNKPIDVLTLAKKVAFLFAMAEHRKTIDVSPTTQQLQ